MNNKDLIAVTSRSFSNNKILRNELLNKYSRVKFNDQNIKFDSVSLIKFLEGCTKAITALETIDESIISQTPNLKVISKYGVGIDMIDQEVLKKYKIKFNAPKGVNKRSVSELTLSMMINLIHRSNQSSDLVSKSIWKQIVGRELTKKTVGIIGAGNVGKDLIKLLIPFKCKILIHDILKISKKIHNKVCYQVSIDELLKESNVVSLHVPLTPLTKNIISHHQLSLMKKDVILLNFARGGLINENDLLESLNRNHLGGVGLDVLNEEPPKKLIYKKLIKNPKVLVTSHIGGSSEEAILNMGRAAINGLQ